MKRGTAFALVFVASVTLACMLMAETACPAEPGRGSIVKPAALYVGLASADLWSTELALRTPGAYEMNPAMRDGRLWKKALQASALTLLDVQLQKRSRKAAWGTRVLAVVVHVAIVRHNLRNARRGQ